MDTTREGKVGGHRKVDRKTRINAGDSIGEEEHGQTKGMGSGDEGRRGEGKGREVSIVLRKGRRRQRVEEGKIAPRGGGGKGKGR